MRIFSIALVLSAVVAILLWCGWAELREAVTRLWLRVKPAPKPRYVLNWGPKGRYNWEQIEDDPPHWADAPHPGCVDK